MTRWTFSFLLSRHLAVLLFLVSAWTSSAKADAILIVSGEIPNRVEITKKIFQNFPRKVVNVKVGSSSVVRFEGVELKSILKYAMVKLDEELRREELQKYLRASSAGNFRVVFSLPEFDDITAIVADKKNGQYISSPEGPLRLVLPDAPRRSRWVRNLRMLTVVRAP